MFSYEESREKLDAIRNWAKSHAYFRGDDPDRIDSFYADSPLGDPNRFTVQRDDDGRWDVYIHRAGKPNMSVPVAGSDLSWVTGNWFPKS